MVAVLLVEPWTRGFGPPPRVVVREVRVSATKGKEARIEELEARLTAKFGDGGKTHAVVEDVVEDVVVVEEEAPPKSTDVKKDLGGWGRGAKLDSSFIVRRPPPREVAPESVVNKKKKKKRDEKPPLLAKKPDKRDEKPPLIAKKPHKRDEKPPRREQAACLSEVAAPSAWEEDTRSFAELGVDEATARALSGELGIEVPTPIQGAVLRTAREHPESDLVVQSPTGSGKTLAYLLATTVGGSFASPRVLIVSPSRELGMQVSAVCDRIGRTCAACCGGANARRQVEKIRAAKPEVVVGTPGRLADLAFERKQLRLGSIAFVVVDEADAFDDAVESLLAAVPRSARLLAVTATSPTEFVDRTSTLSQRARHARIVSPDAGDKHPALAPNLVHGRILVPSRKALDALRRCLRAEDPPVSAALVFADKNVHDLAARDPAYGGSCR